MSTSLSSVISLLKLPREVVENVLILNFLPLAWYRLEVQQEMEQNKKGRCCLKYLCKHFSTAPV